MNFIHPYATFLQDPKPKSTSGERVRLFHDYEWYSEADVTIHGTDYVSRHPTTEALMCAYAFDDGTVQQWVPEEGERMPAELREAVEDPDVIKQSWNKAAEYHTWKNVLGIDIPHDQWRDTMVMAMALSLPGSLAKAGEVVGLPDDKKKSARGKTLIRTFSKPQKVTRRQNFHRRSFLTDPELWEEFKDYNRGDVTAERAIFQRIRKWDLPAHEWELWNIDQEINEAGIPINMAVVRNAIQVYRAVVSRRLNEMREVTGLDNPNSGPQLLPWLREQGYPYEDLKKGHVQRALADVEQTLYSTDPKRPIIDRDEETRDLRRVLELRLEVSKSSVKKYNALLLAADAEAGVLRNAFQFCGAGRTWRWAGRKYQAQNLARPVKWLEDKHAQAAAVRDLEFLDAESIEWLYSSPTGSLPRRSPMDLLSTCVRPVVQAPEGYLLADADLNAIENRVLGWIAGDAKILEVFEQDRDPYVDFAKYLYHRPYAALYAEYKAGDKGPRTFSKPAVLGCGYMLGPGEERENLTTGEIEATGLLGYAWNMGVKLTQEQSTQSVKIWRETFSDVVDFWYAIDKAAKSCVRTNNRTEVGPIWFDRSGPWLRMHLPSGRALHYCRPRIEKKRTPWGEMRPTLTYEGLNDKNQWVRIGTHPGKLTENADQAIARDLLAHGMRLAKREYGLDIRLHVHDQVVPLVRIDRAAEDLKILQECMTVRPVWASDLPLGSAGFTSKFFIKD
jgi:DNA polymerase